MTDQKIENSLENINFNMDNPVNMKGLVRENASILYRYDDISDNLFYISN